MLLIFKKLIKTVEEVEKNLHLIRLTDDFCFSFNFLPKTF